MFIKLFSHKVDPNTGIPLISENIPAALIRLCISYTNTIHQIQIFPDKRIIHMFKDKDTKKKFIVFREKNMNQPLDLQLQDLKRLGLVRKKPSNLSPSLYNFRTE